MPTTAPFRIVHLSDLHLTPGEGDRRSEPNPFGRLRGMNAAFRKVVAADVVQRADLVLVTGDVTDRGALASWHVFWNTLSDAGLRERTYVLPGNHDVCCLWARLPQPRQGYRDADLDRALAGIRLGGRRYDGFPWVAQPDERIALFGLNSNNLGNFTALSNAMGELGKYQLSNLASRMHVHRDVPVKIVAMHHSPNIPEAKVEKRRGLPPTSTLARWGHQIPEAQELGLQLLCITNRVRLLLHGHLHRAEVRRLSGVRIVGAPATTELVHLARGTTGYTFFTYTVHGARPQVRTELALVPP